MRTSITRRFTQFEEGSLETVGLFLFALTQKAP